MSLWVGLTTTPVRLAAGLPRRAIASLLASPLTARVVLTVPHEAHNGALYDEEALEDVVALDARVALHRLPRDEGPLCKLLGLLEAAEAAPPAAQPTWLALADGGVTYQAEVLPSLLAVAAAGGHVAVGFSGRAAPPHTGRVGRRSAVSTRYLVALTAPRLDVLCVETWAGALYERAALASAAHLREFVAALPPPVAADAFFTDDLVIGAWLASCGVPRVLVPSRRTWYTHNARGTPQLSRENHQGRNETVARALFPYQLEAANVLHAAGQRGAGGRQVARHSRRGAQAAARPAPRIAPTSAAHGPAAVSEPLSEPLSVPLPRSALPRSALSLGPWLQAIVAALLVLLVWRAQA
jgi:hypothetical protein